MHEGEGRLEFRIDEVREHPLDLVRAQHPLVDERARGEARKVEELLLRRVERAHGVLDPLANDVELALEGGLIGDTGAARDEDLLDARFHRHRARAERPVIRGRRPPAEHALAFLLGDVMEEPARFLTERGVPRQEHEAGSVGAVRRQRDAEPRGLPAEETIRHLDEDAGAVAGVGLASACPAVQEVDEHTQGLAHDRVGGDTLDVHDEADAAGVVLVAGIVEALGRRWTGQRGMLPHHRVPFVNSCTDSTRPKSISHHAKVV
jgi:hypothetical protein